LGESKQAGCTLRRGTHTPCLRVPCDTQALVRESERRRYADPEQVDRVVALDQAWRDGESLAAAAPSAVTRAAVSAPFLPLMACVANPQLGTRWTT
jgi:hypothetical protein